jgi:hypothetical protein
VDTKAALLLLGVALSGCARDEGDAAPAVEPPPARAREDMALEFDGRDDYASVGTAGFPFPRWPQTVSLWLYREAGTGKQVIITLRKDWESGVSLGLCNGAPCATSVLSGDVYVAANDALPLAEWHHVAYAFDGGDTSPRHTLYVDGDEVATGAAVPNNRTPTRAFLGSEDTNGTFLSGRIDELRIWSVARTSQQLAEEIAGEAPDAEPPDLTLHYSFDEAAGARVLDHSGRGNDALLGDGIVEHEPARVLADRR